MTYSRILELEKKFAKYAQTDRPQQYMGVGRAPLPIPVWKNDHWSVSTPTNPDVYVPGRAPPGLPPGPRSVQQAINTANGGGRQPAPQQQQQQPQRHNVYNRRSPMQRSESRIAMISNTLVTQLQSFTRPITEAAQRNAVPKEAQSLLNTLLNFQRGPILTGRPEDKGQELQTLQQIHQTVYGVYTALYNSTLPGAKQLAYDPAFRGIYDRITKMIGQAQQAVNYGSDLSNAPHLRMPFQENQRYAPRVH